MSCCKNANCKKSANSTTMPADEFKAKDMFFVAQEAVIKLLNIAHLNNRVLPPDISPLKLANLIHELVTSKKTIDDATRADSGNYVLKFGPNKAYELHLPAALGSDAEAQTPDPQKTFDFESFDRI